MTVPDKPERCECTRDSGQEVRRPPNALFTTSISAPEATACLELAVAVHLAMAAQADVLAGASARSLYRALLRTARRMPDDHRTAFVVHRVR